jgi:hypothetical protein
MSLMLPSLRSPKHKILIAIFKARRSTLQMPLGTNIVLRFVGRRRRPWPNWNGIDVPTTMYENIPVR